MSVFKNGNYPTRDNWDRRISLIPYTIEELEDIIQRCVERALSMRSKEGNPLHDEILDCNTVCREYHISIPTLIKYRLDGTIPFFKIGNRIKFKRRDLNKAFERINWGAGK